MATGCDRTSGYPFNVAVQRCRSGLCRPSCRDYIQRFHVRPTERVVGDVILHDWDEFQQLALRRDHIDAGRGIERFEVPRMAWFMPRTRRGFPPYRCSFVATAAGRKVVVHAHVADRSVRCEVVGANQPRAAWCAVGFNQIQGPIVGSDLDTVGALYVRRRENAG